MWLECPFLDQAVELTDERHEHITVEHSELLFDGLLWIQGTIGAPDLVMRSRRSATALLFSRWYDDFLDGMYLVVVVEEDASGRRWVITAHPSDIEIRGDVIWRRS